MAMIQEGYMSAPAQGGLFQGQIFWVSLRVPQRAHLVTKIMANGGTLVTSERNAEICLVDHLKEVGEDMFSYEFITKSLAARELEDLEKYRVRPRYGAAVSVRPKGQRGSRNNFTTEEDNILLETLCQPGIALKGQSVYNRLAEKYPSHTMQSWRNRWVNHFSKIMPDGPVPRRQMAGQVEGQKDVERVMVKREGEQFTEEDEAKLREWADLIMVNPHEIDIYERMNKLHPQHTARQWHAHFNEVVLPKIERFKKSMAKLRRSLSESGVRRGDSSGEGPASSRNRGEYFPEPRQVAKIKPEPTSSPILRHKTTLPASSLSSPIRTVDVSEQPDGTPSSASRLRQPTPHPRPKTATTPSSRVSPPALNIVSITPSAKARKTADHRAGVDKLSTEGPRPITSSAPPKSPSHLPVNQKRKRDSGSLPELRKKPRSHQSRDEIPSTPEPESKSPSPTTQSRALSPELGNSTNRLASSPPLSVPRKKPNYAEMSTQAIYDQQDDDPFLVFPELELPDTPPPPPPPVQSTQSRAQTKLSTPTKLPAPTLGFASRSPSLSPTKDDPDGIREMNLFLAYCQKEYKISEQEVIYAIERASGIKKLVELVLKSVVDNRPLPTHVPGVWSEEEDKVLMGDNSREMEKLSRKKGAMHMERRMDFLNLWNMS